MWILCPKNTPGERCSCDTITRSAPLLMNVPREMCIRDRQLVQIHALQQRIDRLGAHVREELVRIAVVELLIAFRKRVQDVEILLLGQQAMCIRDSSRTAYR